MSTITPNHKTIDMHNFVEFLTSPGCTRDLDMNHVHVGRRRRVRFGRVRLVRCTVHVHLHLGLWRRLLLFRRLDDDWLHNRLHRVRVVDREGREQSANTRR